MIHACPWCQCPPGSKTPRAAPIDLDAIAYAPAKPTCGCSEPDWCPTRRLDEGGARHMVALLLSGDWERAELPAGRTLARYLDGFGLELTITRKATHDHPAVLPRN